VTSAPSVPNSVVTSSNVSFTANPTCGFWSPNPYVEFLHTSTYEPEQVTLGRYGVIEADRRRTIYNRLQHHDTRTLEDELHDHGFDLTTLMGDLTGTPFAPD
jgi:hypothetical protein